MRKSLRQEFESRIDILSKMTKQSEEKIQSLPHGTLSIKKRGQFIYYYHVNEDGAQTFLKKEDSEIIEGLLQKSYLEKVVKANNAEIKALDKIIKIYPEVTAEEVYDQLTEDRKKFVKPVVPTDEQYIKRWQDTPFKPKPMSDDVPYFLTMKGERVRSKSEMIIADRLYIKGIPYKYECPLKIRIGNRVITIHPDFTILRVSDRKVLYLEHCGRMDDPGYTEDMVNRANDYLRGGILQGDRLFFTFETSETPLDVGILEIMIEKNFR